MGTSGALEWIGIFYNELSSKFVGVGSLYFLCSWFFFCAFFFFFFSLLPFPLAFFFICCRGVL